jgi:fatty acid desaturase
MTTDAHRYGLIGAAFGMVSWLFAAALVLVVTAALGARLGARGHEANEAGVVSPAPGRAPAASSS